MEKMTRPEPRRECIFCKSEFKGLDELDKNQADYFIRDCPKCGKYEIEKEAENIIPDLSKSNPVNNELASKALKKWDVENKEEKIRVIHPSKKFRATYRERYYSDLINDDLKNSLENTYRKSFRRNTEKIVKFQ